MGGWGEFVLAFVFFFASHMLPTRPPVRAALVGVLGERLYLAAYALLSIGALAFVIAAAGRAPYVELWPFRPWQLWAPNLAMPLVCLLAAYGVAAPNPLSIAGRRSAPFDPDRPGIAGLTRHPILWAFALWAGAHLVPNGDLAHVIVFGAFLLFALLGILLLDRRLRRRLGDSAWQRLAARTSAVPFAALLAGRWRPRGMPDPVRLMIAVAVYAIFMLLHRPVIGVPPFPAA